MSDIPTDPQEEQPTPPTPSPAEGEPGDNADAANPAMPAADEHGLTPEQYRTRVDAPYVSETPAPDVVTTADDVTRPASTAAAPTAPGIPDETHNSIDPQTGALTQEALARRNEILVLVQEAGHAVGSFEEAIRHWIEMEGAKSPPGDLS